MGAEKPRREAHLRGDAHRYHLLTLGEGLAAQRRAGTRRRDLARTGHVSGALGAAKSKFPREFSSHGFFLHI